MEAKAATNLIDMNQAAAYLGLRKSTLYEWVSKKQIEHIKVGRLVKFQPRQLDQWIAGHTVKAKRTTWA